MDDLDRLRAEYADRKRRLANSDRYSLSNPARRFEILQRQHRTLELLLKRGFLPLSGTNILEIGCGAGGVLDEYLGFGADPGYLHGCDLLADSLHSALQRFPVLPLACADGQDLPYPAGAFDLVLQYTVFTSLLDPAIKKKLAREILRVLKPGGMILWYDFCWNPTNPQTRGIRPAEIRELFPGCRYEFQRITLAPPVTRLLVPLSWGLCLLLERIKLFNSHYLVAIQVE
ncbi:MAG: class I SAM-dependent methyltransferase [Chloroflexota bacterium]